MDLDWDFDFIGDNESFLHHFDLFNCPFSQLPETDKGVIREKIERYVQWQVKDRDRYNMSVKEPGLGKYNYYNTEFVNLFPIFHPELITITEFLDWMGWGVTDPLGNQTSKDTSRNISLLYGFFYTLLRVASDLELEFTLNAIKLMIEGYRVPINFEFTGLYRKTPLLYLAIENDLAIEIIQYLLSCGADPYIEDIRGNALYYAVNHPDDAVLQLFLDKFSHLTLKDKQHLILLACNSYRPPTIDRLRLLIDRGCDAGARGISIIYPYDLDIISPLRRLFLHEVSTKRIKAGMLLFKYASDYDQPLPRGLGDTLLSMLCEHDLSHISICQEFIALIRRHQSFKENSDDMEYCGSYSEDED